MAAGASADLASAQVVRRLGHALSGGLALSEVAERKPAHEVGGARVSVTSVRGQARVPLGLALAAILGVALAACGGNGSQLGERVIPFGQPVPKGGGVYMVGKPYQIGGIWYTPREDPSYNRVGRASWYGELFHGRRTANGEIYDMDRLSAASPVLPLPVYVQVTNLENGRTIVVRVNDRGPYANDRILDLSRRSAEVLGFRASGTALVRVKYLGRAPLSGDDRYEQKFLASQSFMQVAAKGSRKGKAARADIASLPPENPENLDTPWKNAAPAQPAEEVAHRASLQAKPDQAAQGQASSYGWTVVAAPKEAEAIPFDAPLSWQTSPRGAEKAQPSATGALPQFPSPAGSFLIQAGSFKNRENADRARGVLSPIGPVELAETGAAGNVYFRVRIGPFADRGAAEAALSKVAEAGYQGATIIAKK